MGKDVPRHCMSPAASPLSDLGFLSGGGEMGARMRTMDWRGTSLGPPETWPQSLRVALSIMLASRQPIWIGWGLEFVYFYNDSYKPIIGRSTWSYTPIPNDDGTAGGISCANTDETQRVIGERQLTVLHELATKAAPRILEPTVPTVYLGAPSDELFHQITLVDVLAHHADRTSGRDRRVLSLR